MAAAGDVWLTVHLILPVHEAQRVIPQVVALLSVARPAVSPDRELHIVGVIEGVAGGVIVPLMPSYCCIFLAFALSFFWRDIPHIDSTTAGLKVCVTAGVYDLLFFPAVKSHVLEVGFFFFLAPMTRAFVTYKFSFVPIKYYAETLERLRERNWTGFGRAGLGVEMVIQLKVRMPHGNEIRLINLCDDEKHIKRMTVSEMKTKIAEQLQISTFNVFFLILKHVIYSLISYVRSPAHIQTYVIKNMNINAYGTI